MEFLITIICLLCISISRSACPWKCWKEDVDGLCQMDDDYYELSCEVDSISLTVHACAFFDLITDSPSSQGLIVWRINDASNYKFFIFRIG